MAQSVKVDFDCFKDTFKRFKKLSVQELDGHVINFRDPKKFGQEVEQLTEKCISSEGTTESSVCKAVRLGLRPPVEWRIYGLSEVPGLMVIPNPFLPCGQHEWVRRSLSDYPLKPNVCNLDAHTTRQNDGRLWPQPSEIIDSKDPTGVPAKRNSLESQLKLKSDVNQKLLEEEARGCSEDKIATTKRIKLSKSDVLLPPWLTKDSLLYKLRWVTLGYHYNWSTKEYTPDNVSPFPEELSQLSSFVLEMAGFPKFNAEACIVNYYHLDSTLSGHTDHSEKDLSLPLLSISFGQSAVFLIGGQTKQVKPLPLLLNSGDIVIMSGDSRLAYHGVPRIIPPPKHGGSLVPWGLSMEPLVNCECWKETVKLRSTASVEETKKQGTINVFGVEGGHWPTSGYAQLEVQRNEPSGVCGDCAEDTLPKNLSAESANSGKDSCPSCDKLANSWHIFMDYMSVSRVNINVRQVVSDKFKFDKI